MGKFLRTDQVEIEILREILPQQTVGVLVGAAFPRMVRVCEVHRHAALLFQVLPVAELGAVVEREGLSLCFWDATEALERERREELRPHLGQEESDQVPAPAVDERDDAHAFVATHDRIALPVADPGASFHDRRPLVDAALLCLLPGFLADLCTAPASVCSFLASQESLQVRRALVEVPVYGACRKHPSFGGKRTADLFRRPVFFQFFHDRTQECALERPNAIHGGNTQHALPSAHFAHIVCAPASIACDVAVDGAWILAKRTGDLRTCVSGPQHTGNDWPVFWPDMGM